MTAEGYLDGEIFLGELDAKQNLSGIVIELAREEGERAKELATRVTGTVTEDGAPVSGGRVGAWATRREEQNRINAAVQRGRTVPMGAFELHWSPVGPDGAYAIERIRPDQRFGAWYLVYEAPDGAPTIVGPIEIVEGGREKTVDIDLVAGGSIAGEVAHMPEAMAGQVWVVAFDGGVIRREVLAEPDGSFRMENMPPGRYGLKAGHDAYEDPHVPDIQVGEPGFSDIEKSAEPWQGAEVVMVEPGRTVGGVIVDLRPPGPLVDPEAGPGAPASP